MALETSAESPVPVRTVARLIGGWIARLGRVWIDGQLTEVTRRGNTAFLTLRDPAADISLNLLAPRSLVDSVSPPLQDGARVVVWGKPEYFERRGTLSLQVFDIRHVGVGELLARLERLKGVLAAEGLFDERRKRPLPFLPNQIGLICGRGSAAERDVCENAKRRWPAVRFRIEPVAVQGLTAVAEVIDALRRLEADPDVDVIVITRGGGSTEDLLPFSDEALVRAASACFTPIVSAIGHEQDSPLLDLVADVRASTPTDAAKRVVPDVSEELMKVRQLHARARHLLNARLERERALLNALRSRPALASPLLDLARRRDEVLALRARSRRCLTAALDRGLDDLTHVIARVRALSPAATLDRGYSIVQHADGHVVRTATDTSVGEELDVRLAQGHLRVRVEDVDPHKVTP
jgi:exodeoxyribonuclease VII large subunit